MQTILAVLVGGLAAADPSLTIYNRNFAVIREMIPVNLKSGINPLRYTGTTISLEPDSVILRDPAERSVLKIVEQNFRAEPVSEGLLLSLYEGKELDFEVTPPSGGEKRIVRAKVIRSGYAPARFRNVYPPVATEPIIEIGGKLSFALPGRPIFPALSDGSILKPTLDWKIYSDRDVKFDAELSYMSAGLSWKADYNLIAPEKGDQVEFAGWITIDNQSGKEFEKARIKLVAGDVNKVVQPNAYYAREMSMSASAGMSAGNTPTVAERRFDEYHLYTLPLTTTLFDRETKQVEFVRTPKVSTQKFYVYDGAKNLPAQPSGNEAMYYLTRPEYGNTESSTKVAVYREFDNVKANGLGIALPRGRVRFYRRSGSGAVEFTGENNIDHTPQDEKVRAYTGDAFDLVGERKRLNFQVDQNGRTVTESFEIRLRNRKEEKVEIRVVEHMFRWTNWKLINPSLPFRKTDSRTVEFLVPVDPGQEQVLTYVVQYSW